MIIVLYLYNEVIFDQLQDVSHCFSLFLHLDLRDEVSWATWATRATCNWTAKCEVPKGWSGDQSDIKLWTSPGSHDIHDILAASQG